MDPDEPESGPCSRTARCWRPHWRFEPRIPPSGGD